MSRWNRFHDQLTAFKVTDDIHTRSLVTSIGSDSIHKYHNFNLQSLVHSLIKQSRQLCSTYIIILILK
jgi:hypothetical protein